MYFGLMRYERYIMVAMLAAVWMGLLDTPLYYLNNLVWELLSLGHPVGASGARIIVTLLHEMQKRPEAKKGLATLCIGGGMGTAVVLEKCRM